MVQLANGSEVEIPTPDTRFLAWLVDTIVILAATFGAQQLFWAMPPASLAGFRDFWLLDRIISFALFFFGIYVVHDVLLHWLSGTTLGKFLVGACLVSTVSCARVTWRQAIGRTVLKLPLGATILGQPTRQGIHDFLANTIVICREHSNERRSYTQCADAPPNDQ